MNYNTADLRWLGKEFRCSHAELYWRQLYKDAYINYNPILNYFYFDVWLDNEEDYFKLLNKNYHFKDNIKFIRKLDEIIERINNAW